MTEVGHVRYNDTETLKRPADEDDIVLNNADESNMEHSKRRKIHSFAAMTQYSEESSPTGVHDFLPPGYIRRINLRNFMCHEHFELELGPKLNFIVGNNGSGKSAILTAIAVALGAKVADTNRGRALRDLIREGCNSARITLWLDNGGNYAFQPEIYGDAIVIERILRRGTAAAFSLRTGKGKEVSNKKRDIQTIIDFFSIPVSNPMCFLSQDAARSFLTASTPQEKYLHFMRGTLLQDIATNLEKAQEVQRKAYESLSYHQDNLKMLKESHHKSKKILEELNKSSNLAETKRLLQAKSIWIDVDANIASANEMKEKLMSYKQKSKDADNKISYLSDQIQENTNHIESYSKEIESLKSDKLLKMSDHEAAQHELRKFRDNYEMEKRNKSEVQSNIEKCQHKIESLSKTISKLEMDLKRETGGDKQLMQDTLKRLESEQDALSKKDATYNIMHSDLKNREHMIMVERQSELRYLETGIAEKQSELGRLSGGHNNLLANFDYSMENFLRHLKENQHKFHKLPLGPLGLYVRVKPEYQKWAKAIQRCISATLSTFVVCDQHDNRVLQELMRKSRLKIRFPILTYQLGSFDYRQGKARCQAATISDALEFENNDIECLFVDRNKIERVILVSEQHKARQILRSKPANVRMALSLRDAKSGFQLQGGNRIDTVMYQEKLRLKVGKDSKEESTYIEDLIMQERKDLQSTRTKYDQKIRELRQEFSQIMADQRILQQNISNNYKRITDLKIKLSKEVDTGILNSKLNEKSNLESALASYEQALIELDIKLDQIGLEAEPYKAQYDNTKTAINIADERLAALDEKIKDREYRAIKIKDDIKALHQKKEVYAKKIVKAMEFIDELGIVIGEQLAKANEFCSKEKLNEYELPSTQSEIRLELTKVSRKILAAEQSLGVSHAEAVRIFEKNREAYKIGQERYSKVEEALRMLENSINQRLQNFKLAQRMTCFDADFDFRASLKVRKFSGNLSFSNEQKTLDIFILTPNDEIPRKVDNLSGGEKSFSQMALLLATWKPMRSRIIALDEFDVFMDQVNRKIGTSLIVKKLKDNPRTQTIIITPQDIGKITDIDSDGVRIHKIRDPERQNNSNFYG